MLPNTRSKEQEYKQRKRKIEIEIIIEHILKHIQTSTCAQYEKLDILEFGCGSGFQIPYLNKIGRVTASDILSNDEIKKTHCNYVQCSITNTPFCDAQFDVIFSSHVIEHLDDITNAFREIKRIGNSSCIYAFSVPTNIWLLLSIPAQYYNKLRKIISMLDKNNAASKSTISDNHTSARIGYDISFVSRLLRFLLPGAHGVSSSFIECYRKFRIKNWQRLFVDNGFSVIEVKPLLLYGASELPIIPISRAKKRLCSSVLYLMKKQS